MNHATRTITVGTKHADPQLERTLSKWRANAYEPKPLTFDMLAEGARRLAETVADPNPVELCHPSDPRLVHAAPWGVTAEHFNVLEHPRFPCGTPTTIDHAWKPRRHQVTCADCARALDVVLGARLTPELLAKLGPEKRDATTVLLRLPSGVWSGG